MRLSEAIRLGSMLRPKAYGALFIDAKSCAKGAACEATGYSYREDLIFKGAEEHLHRLFPAYRIINEMPCPVCGRSTDCIGTIAHLNDNAFGENKHDWTREQIADWVATIEPAESPALVPDPVPVTASALGGEG